MTDITTIAARRYSELHSGFQLVTAIEAAIPVSWLSLDLVALERQPLPVVEEFVLRLCRQGVDTIPDIAAVLGVDHDVVQAAVAGQLSAETIDYRLRYRPGQPGVRSISLTAAGTKAVTDLEIATPQRVEQPYAFDRLRWVPTEHTRSEIIARDEAQAGGLVLLPSSRTREVTTQDVTPRALNALMTDAGEDFDPTPSRRPKLSAKLEVLAVEAVTRQPRRFLPVVLLVFSALDFDEVRLSVVVDDLVSEPHDRALLEAGGAAKVGITVAAPVREPALPAPLLEQRAAYDTVRGLQKRADNTLPVAPFGTRDSAPDDSATARAELAALTVRAVPTYEHRELLAQALRDTRRRFLLITSGLRASVINNQLIAQLERMLRRRELVAHIAYGVGHPDAEHDPEAVKRLTRLAERHANLTLVRVAEAATPCLIFDDTWVNSSFDWLSFRGGQARTYRREEGTLISAADIVHDRYAEALSAIESNRTT
jgi:hypothetical protein